MPARYSSRSEAISARSEKLKKKALESSGGLNMTSIQPEVTIPAPTSQATGSQSSLDAERLDWENKRQAAYEETGEFPPLKLEEYQKYYTGNSNPKVKITDPVITKKRK